MSVIQSDPVSNSRPSPAYIEIGSVDSSTNFAIEERSNSSASPFIQRDPAINSQLCLECLRIDVVDGSAHHTLEGLRNSARDGCPCCKIIARTLDGAEQVSSEHPEMRLRKYQDKQHLSVSTASETPESNRHKESRQSIIFTPFSLSSLGIDEPMSFMRSDFWGNGSSGEALIARPPYYAKSSISADKRRNMLFYTVYDCKSLERKSREPGKVVRRLELCRIRGMYGNHCKHIFSIMTINSP